MKITINLTFDLTVSVKRDLKEEDRIKITDSLKRGVNRYISCALDNLSTVYPALKDCEINLDIDN